MKNSIAHIHINGIEVGSIPTSTYNSIVKSVKKTPTLYAKWGWNIVALVAQKAAKYVCAIPAVVTAMALALAIFDPEGSAQIIAQLKASSPEEIVASLRSMVYLIMMCGIFVIPVIAVVTPQSWKVGNPVEDEISMKIRSFLKVPASGPMWIIVTED